jgi:hypothetical protein
VAVAAPAVLVGGILAAAPVAAQDASAAPAPSAPPALTAEVIEIIGQVEVVRELPVLTEVAWQLGDRETALTEQLDKEIAKPETADRFAQDERILTRLGLVPEGTDLLALTVDTLQGQVAGFFDPETDSLTVLDDDGELDLASRITLAHEVDHAIGDQHWDLQAMKDAIPLLEGDRQSALQALIEGDATLLMTLWSAKHAASDMLGMDESALPGGQSLDGLPQIIQRQLLFPYLDGLTFVMSAWGPRGWAGVDALWDAPPVSTEQILHPEKYPDEQPIEVVLPDVAALLGDGWTETGETVMGELGIQVLAADGAEWDPMSFTLGGQTMPNAEVAAGWGGDRLVTVDGPEGAWALVWQTAWDTEDDAIEFFDGGTAALASLPYAQFASSEDITGTGLAEPVLIVLASDESTMDLVTAALEVGPSAG